MSMELHGKNNVIINPQIDNNSCQNLKRPFISVNN
jgi:hypothetical protein